MRKIIIPETGWSSRQLVELRNLVEKSQSQLSTDLDIPISVISHNETSNKVLPSAWRTMLTFYCKLHGVQLEFEKASNGLLVNTVNMDFAEITGDETMSKSPDVIQIQRGAKEAVAVSAQDEETSFDVRLGDQGKLGPQLSRWVRAHHGGVDHIYVVDHLNDGIKFADADSMSVRDQTWFDTELTKLKHYSSLFNALSKVELPEGAEPLEIVHAKSPQFHRMIASIDDAAEILLVAVSEIRGTHYVYSHAQIEKDMRVWRKTLRDVFTMKPEKE